jgi:formylmethanofuran dehydrogenase subunit E
VPVNAADVIERWELSADDLEPDVVRCHACGDYVDSEDSVPSPRGATCRHCTERGEAMA